MIFTLKPVPLTGIWFLFVMVPVMIIRQFRFDDLRFSSDAEEHRAIAILTTDISTLCLMTSAKLQSDVPPASLAEALAEDALRQIRRMPEYRRQADAVQVAEDAPKEFQRAS